MAQEQKDQEEQIKEQLAAGLVPLGTTKSKTIADQIRVAIINARDGNNQVNLNNLQKQIIINMNANKISDLECTKLINELYKDLIIRPTDGARALLDAIEKNSYRNSKTKLLSAVPELQPVNGGGNKPAPK
jgi:hypothetical protein